MVSQLGISCYIIEYEQQFQSCRREMSTTGRKRHFPREGPSTDEHGNTEAACKWEVSCFFFFFSCLWSCTKSSCYCPTWVHLQKFISSTALIFYFFLPLSPFLPWFAWKMTWMLLCRHVSIVLIDSGVIYILNYNDIDIFIFHKHLLWKIYIVKFVIGWILFLVK